MCATQDSIVNIHGKPIPAVLSGSVDVKSQADTKEGDELFNLRNNKLRDTISVNLLVSI